MKKQFLVLAAIASTAIITIVAVSCKRNLDPGFSPRATQAGHLPAGLPEKKLPLVITSNTSLSRDTLWVLDGKCYVSNNATLQIEEGATIAGRRKSTTDSASALIITRGAKISAIGNEDNPIVFTSYESCPQSGDWGGIVLLGRACLNRADTTIEGINLPSVPAGVDIQYGGGGACNCQFPNDNSGTIQFARIEYAGAVITEGNELNGLTCGAVGAGTTLDHIEVAYGNDDAFEFFGGNVNLRYVIALVPDDDAFDFDFGYTGSIQNAVSVLKNGTDVFGVTINYSSNPNGIESDNAPSCGSTCISTNPHLSNLTVIGFEDSLEALTVPTAGLFNGAHFRNASLNTVRNSVFMGFRRGVTFECPASIAGATGFQYNTVHGFQLSDNGASIDGTNTEVTGAIANGSSIDLINPFDACEPDFRPSASSPLLNSSSVNYAGLPSFIVAKTYRGAFANSGADAFWDREAWVKYDYERYCVNCGN